MRKNLFLAGLIFALIFSINIYSADTTAFSNPFKYKFNVVNPQEIYKEFIHSLNPLDLSNFDKALAEFNKLFKGLPPNQTNAAFSDFWNYYIKTADSIAGRLVYNKKYIQLVGIVDYNTHPEKYSDLKKINLDNLTNNDFEVLASLNHYGFKFDLTDGLLFINFSSPEYILNNLKGSLSNSMEEYIKQTFKEAAQKPMNDGKIILPLKNIAQRVIWWESFINHNQNFILVSECRMTYKFYMSLLFSGDEQAAFDGYNSKSIDEKYRQTYKEIINNYNGTKTAEAIGKYYRLLQENGFKVNREIESFAENFQP